MTIKTTNKSDVKLRECPYCGECGILHKRNNYYTVECPGCSCEQSCGFVTEQQAITAWNTRANDHLLELALEALKSCKVFAGCELEYDTQLVEETLLTLQQHLGKE